MKVVESKKRTEAGEESAEKPLQKKTRDLPNLTQCHACGFKFDLCTGKNTLRLLYSEWRVLLLCKKCFSSVQSSQICSYCFSGASPESFRCNQCHHSVHKSCFFKYRNAPPWSYAPDFSVCVDCWIPKHVAISRRRKSRLKGGENGSGMLEKGNSRALQSMEENVEVAARAREGATKTLVANREEPSKIDAVKVLDGSELTFELHPHLNSLPKSCCISYSDAPKTGASTSSVNSRNDGGGHQHNDTCKSLCEPSVSVGSLDSGSSTDLNLLCIGLSDMETGSKDGEELVKEGEGSCSCRPINFTEDSGGELNLKQADSALHREEQRCKDSYFLKYSRRKSSLKPNLGSKPKSC